MILTALPFILAMSGQAAPPPQQPPPAVPAVAIQKPGAPQAPRKIYNETADAKAAIAAAVSAVAEDGIRVLINWGGNDCPRCASYPAAQKDILATVKMSDEYRTVYVDVGKGEKNADVAASLGVTLSADALPQFTVLDAKGVAIAQASGKDYVDAADAAKLDGKQLATFLSKHQAPAPPDPAPQLAAALAQAKREDKQVFLWFSAPW